MSRLKFRWLVYDISGTIHRIFAVSQCCHMTEPNITRDQRAWSCLERALDQLGTDDLGQEMMELMARLFPICRSITGDGVRETLKVLRERIDLKIEEVPSGYKAFDWKVPREWNIRDAYVKNERGERVIDFKESNLHVVSYSVPVSATMTLEELRPHLYPKPELPDAVPYLTSYYDESWGFCLSQRQLDAMPEGRYEVLIDSSLTDGHLTYADAVLPGKSEREILFSTYICHPSMANNELAGPVLAAFLYQLLAQCELRYTYRFAFVPETIGALVYLSKHGDHLRRNLEAGYVVTCVGDDGPFTFKRSRQGDTVADKVAEHCLRRLGEASEVKVLDFFPSGSDERQYCSPGFDLPVGSLMRSMYGTYPEYHTSLDNMEFVSAEGIAGALKAYLRLVQAHELNAMYVNTSPYGEPQLSRRGLYPKLGAQTHIPEAVERMMYLLAYSDGTKDLVDIANLAGRPAWEFAPEILALQDAGLLVLRD